MFQLSFLKHSQACVTCTNRYCVSAHDTSVVLRGTEGRGPHSRPHGPDSSHCFHLPTRPGCRPCSAEQAEGTGRKSFWKTHRFHQQRVRAGLEKLFFKKAESAVNEISCHPLGPHLVRNHVISSAPQGHLFPTANRAISGKFWSPGTIICVIMPPVPSLPKARLHWRLPALPLGPLYTRVCTAQCFCQQEHRHRSCVPVAWLSPHCFLSARCRTCRPRDGSGFPEIASLFSHIHLKGN
jgi:hypothetical protein